MIDSNSNSDVPGDGALETPPDPREMLALLEQQQRHVDVAQSWPIAWLYLIWGVAWLVGYLALWSVFTDGNPWLRIPVAAGVWTFAVLIAGSIVASAVIGSRINRGVRGLSDFSGTVYGLSWAICGSAFAAVGIGLIANGMSGDLASLYFPSAYGLMCGTLYLGGAALWRDRGQLVLGIVLLVVASVAPFFGSPTNNLVTALVSGGAFLVGAVVVIVRTRRGR